MGEGEEGDREVGALGHLAGQPVVTPAYLFFQPALLQVEIQLYSTLNLLHILLQVGVVIT